MDVRIDEILEIQSSLKETTHGMNVNHTDGKKRKVEMVDGE